jgi:hypothetical protein
MKMTEALRAQIEAAYDYRGHVTVTLKDGKTVEGFLYNREFENPRVAEDHFVELMLKDSEERRRLKIEEISSVALTGQRAN